MSQNLKKLISDLREGSISAIEFGNPTDPGGYLSDHQITCVKNEKGIQFCFKHFINGGFGSGAHIGDFGDSVLRLSAKWVLDYYSNTNPKLETNFDAKNMTNQDLEYFAVEK